MTDINEPYKPKPAVRSNTWIYLTIIGLLLGTNVFLYLQKEKTQKSFKVVQTKIVEKDTAISNLQSEYNASLVRLDDLVSKNVLIEKQLKDKNSELNLAKQKIETILQKEKITKQELEEARRLIGTLNERITVYETQIKELKKENKQLVKQRDSVAANVAELQQKVDLGKILHASNIRLKGLRLTHGGNKEMETEKAKRVDLLRITFDIDENRLEEGGKKELNICIINPNEELISNAALGSGSFLMPDGRSKYYSVSRTVALIPGEDIKDVNVDWQQSGNYAKGIYVVEIYHKGYLIGKGSVSLR